MYDIDIKLGSMRSNMKHLFASTILTLLLTNTALAQQIVGIGDLKIGMSEQEFLELPEIKVQTIQDAGKKNLPFNSSVWKKTSSSIPPERFAINPQLSKLWKIYSTEYITYDFTMSTGIKDEFGKDEYPTLVEFYKNEMISIRLILETTFNQFDEVLKAKYGKPTIKNNLKKETCQNGYGARTEHDNGNIMSVWEGQPIEAYLMIRTTGCGKYITKHYRIENSKKKSALDDLESKGKDGISSQDIKSKASSSKL
jgi:hypothetical protein